MCFFCVVFFLFRGGMQFILWFNCSLVCFSLQNVKKPMGYFVLGYRKGTTYIIALGHIKTVRKPGKVIKLKDVSALET